MRTERLFSAVLTALLVSMAAAVEDSKTTTTRSTVVTLTSGSNSTNSNSTSPTHRMPGGLNVDNMVIQRALYVLIGFTMLGVLYLLIRAVRMKRPVQKKKYGLLENCEDGVELDPLESEEDDTLYEARTFRR